MHRTEGLNSRTLDPSKSSGSKSPPHSSFTRIPNSVELEMHAPGMKVSAQVGNRKSKADSLVSLSGNFMRNEDTVTNDNDIFQYSILSVPRGSAIQTLDVHILSACGDHGIGVLSGNHGEVLYIKNQSSQIQVDEGGYVTIRTGARIPKVPLTFFMGVRFKPQIVAMKEGMNVAKLEALFHGNSGAMMDAFTSFKITGAFDIVTLRVIGAATQPAPFSLTLEDMAERASKRKDGHIDIEKTKGTIFGFCAPTWAKDVCFTGVMCWFRGIPKIVNKQSKASGVPRPPWVGHVADFKTRGFAKVEWAVAQKWNLQTNDGGRYSAVRPGAEKEVPQSSFDPANVVVINSSDEDESSSEDNDEDMDSDSSGESNDGGEDEDFASEEDMGSGNGSNGNGSGEDSMGEDDMTSEAHDKTFL
jgi:alpha-acetolactate decarboxylase